MCKAQQSPRCFMNLKPDMTKAELIQHEDGYEILFNDRITRCTISNLNNINPELVTLSHCSADVINQALSAKVILKGAFEDLLTPDYLSTKIPEHFL